MMGSLPPSFESAEWCENQLVSTQATTLSPDLFNDLSNGGIKERQTCLVGRSRCEDAINASVRKRGRADIEEPRRDKMSLYSARKDEAYINI